MIKSLKHITFYSLLLLIYSCSGTKGLAPEESLFSMIDIEISDADNITDKEDINKQITLATPLTNEPGILNIKTGFYNIYADASNGFRNTVKNKLGSKPVVFKHQILENTTAKLQKLMLDNGYFRTSVQCDSTLNNRKINIKCTIDAGPRYMIDSVIFPFDTLPISQELNKFYNLKYLKKGNYYSQSDLVNERASLSLEGKSRGYIYLELKDIQYYVDTTRNNLGADVYLEILPPQEGVNNYSRYVNGDIYIQTDYSLENIQEAQNSVYDKATGLNFIGNKNLIRPSAFDKFILLKKGDYINVSNQKLSINRLLDMGIFKFVNNKMVARGDTLDQYFYMTPDKMKNITGEFELNNRSGNLLGTVGSVGFIHKNLFGGAERFKIALSGGVETQFGDQSFINTSEISAETTLEFPRLAIPFINAQTTKYFVPKTLVSAAISFERRINYYAIQNQKFRYGFRWKEDKNKTHELYPLDLVHLYVGDKSAEFDSLINLPSNSRLLESYQDLLIFGVYYSFTYNNTPEVGSRKNIFLKGTFESAGNTFRAISRKDSLFSTPISQYVKLTGDARKYWEVGNSDIATRLFTGVGAAYGNSTELPYSRQFSIGGANSLRAYRLRGLGPGSSALDTSSTTQYIDQIGDIKLEMNAEYRFPILGFFKGAVFLDAGNIWLLGKGQEVDQEFRFDNFYNQIAIGTGLGLRLDFDFFVFRFDFAFPVRGPRDDGQFEWKLSDIDPFNKNWRSGNLRFNLGIGYPF